MNRSIYFISLLFWSSCQNNSDSKLLYSFQYQQDSNFDKSDIDLMLNDKYNVIDESQLNDSINWKKMKLVDSVFLKENECKVYMYHFDSENNGDYLCYMTKDNVKLIAYVATKIDTELIYVLRDYKFKKELNELIKNDKFIFNQLNEK